MMNVLAIIDGIIPSVELCVLQPLEFLSAAGEISYKVCKESGAILDLASSDFDVVVAMRSVTGPIIRLMWEAKRLGIPFLYMTDDDFTKISRENFLGRAYQELGAYENFSQILSGADLVATFSSAMAIRLQNFSQKVIQFTPISGLALLDQLPPVVRQADEAAEIRIGFSGSITHDRDVEVVVDVLAELIDADGSNIVVESIGQEILGLRGKPRYRHFQPVRGLDNFARLLHSRNWDIGVAPMETSDMNDVKTDNKYRTYASACIPSIYSNVRAFHGVVHDGINGLVVGGTDEAWRRALHRLISDVELRHKIRDAAKEDVQRRYSLKALTDSYLGAWRKLVDLRHVLVLSRTNMERFQKYWRLPVGDLTNANVARFRFLPPSDLTDADLEWGHAILIGLSEFDGPEAIEPLLDKGLPIIALVEDRGGTVASLGKLWNQVERIDQTLEAWHARGVTVAPVGDEADMAGETASGSTGSLGETTNGRAFFGGLLSDRGMK